MKKQEDLEQDLENQQEEMEEADCYANLYLQVGDEEPTFVCKVYCDPDEEDDEQE